MEKEKIYVPPIKIQGIKTKLVPLIKEKAIFTPDTVWIEPFMGSGAVGFNAAPKNAVFADTNPHIIRFYNDIKAKKITSYIVREFLEEEGRKLEKLDCEYYYEVRERFNKNHEPLDFLFLNRSCFNGMMRFNKNLEFNVPYGHKPQRFSKAYVTKIVNQVKNVEALLECNNWEFVCQSFEKTIAKAPSDSFIYCDPPYIGRHVDYYDSWNEEQELKLCQALKQTKGLFLLSTWDHNAYRCNDYINKIWNFCHKYTREHFYYIGAKENNRNAVTEALLSNYDMPSSENNNYDEYEQLKLYIS